MTLSKDSSGLHRFTTSDKYFWLVAVPIALITNLALFKWGWKGTGADVLISVYCIASMPVFSGLARDSKSIVSRAAYKAVVWLNVTIIAYTLLKLAAMMYG